MRILFSAAVILGVSTITGIVAPSLFEALATRKATEKKQLPALRSAFTFRFIGVAIVVGMTAAFAYTSLALHFPKTTFPLFLGLGLGLPLAMSLAAWFVLQIAGITGDLKATWGRIMLLNLVWGLSYGMINPLILRFL
ncbi:MAG: hypothetical protein GTO18_04515 [Anaerolineales bacterium]|nr:hypothetical protein [Anaerolineales bacterium]